MTEDQEEFKITQDENWPPDDFAWNHKSAMYNTTTSNPTTVYNTNLNAPLSSVCKNIESSDQEKKADKTKSHLKSQTKKIESNPEDHFDSNAKEMESKLVAWLKKSYKGKIKISIQKFEREKQNFIDTLAPSGACRFHACLQVGAIYYRGHMDEDSLKWLKKAEECSKNLPIAGNEEDFKKLHSTLGDILIKAKEYNEAKAHLEKALEILETMNPPDQIQQMNPSDIKFLSWNRANMGQLLTEGPIKNYEQAEQMFKDSITLKKELKNDRLIGLGYDYLADFYVKTGDYVKAMECVEEALKNTRKFEEKYYLKKGKLRDKYYLQGRHLRNRGRIYYQQGNLQTAMDDYREALNILEIDLCGGNALSIQYKQEFHDLFGEPWNFQG